jgi:hypothetical protein
LPNAGAEMPNLPAIPNCPSVKGISVVNENRAQVHRSWQYLNNPRVAHTPSHNVPSYGESF